MRTSSLCLHYRNCGTTESTSSIPKLIVRIVILFVSLMSSELLIDNKVLAQSVSASISDERASLAHMISNGTEQLNVSASAIHDSLLIDALRKAAQTRHVNVLIDQPSQEINDLVGIANLDIRRPNLRGSNGMSSNANRSTVTVVYGRGRVAEWNGPPVWNSDSFGRQFTVMRQSGVGPGESTKPTERFDRNFAQGTKLTSYSKRHGKTFALVGVVLLVMISAAVLWRRHVLHTPDR